MNPYQRHSETSKAAALSLVTKQECIAKMLGLFTQAGKIGLTGDELNKEFPSNVHRGTISARLIELERNRDIVKTTNTRLSRSRRQGAVYVLVQHSDGNIKPVKNEAHKRDFKALESIVAIFFTMIKDGQLPSGDSKIHVTPFDVSVLNNLAKRAQVAGVKVEFGSL